MPSTHDDRNMDRLQSIVNHLDSAIRTYHRVTSFDEFVRDTTLLQSTLFDIIQISENAAKLSLEKLPAELKSVPWHSIRGTRNHIVHDYGAIDFEVVRHILDDDLPRLYSALISCGYSPSNNSESPLILPNNIEELS